MTVVTEPRIAPSRCRAHGIYLGIGPRVLVTDQSSVGSVRSVLARLPAGLPVYLITREECQVDSCVPCLFDVRPLICGPILVVPDGEKCLVIGQKVATN